MREDSVPNPLESQISAFLDGELPQGEAELLMRRLGRDPALQHAFSRYALIGEAMRTPQGTPGLLPTRGFADRVSQALAAVTQEAAGSIPPAQANAGARGPRWLKPAAGFTIAAGVAVLAVGLFTQDPESPQAALLAANPASAVTTLEEDASLDEASYIVPEIAMTGPLVPAARLTNYVMAHSEYTSPLGRRNVLSGMLADDMLTDAALPAGYVPEPAPARWIQP